ncbi:hypothetical protein [Streptomyces hiroshimensis]|uniref:Uncharacterized protein n=1 Tax=Streptomyces hiroshimensis TaxID=66424 RepID=A0ABQ2Y612_9ACTN|nr:hypothetical protein GCM10010324_10940 [Streptomyces hiroshimensis]
MRSPIVPAATLSARILNWPTGALSHTVARFPAPRPALPAAGFFATVFLAAAFFTVLFFPAGRGVSLSSAPAWSMDA